MTARATPSVLARQIRRVRGYLQDTLTRKQRITLLAWALLLPGMTIWFLYRILPFLWNSYLSFFEMDATGATEWVGLDHFTYMLSDPVFRTSVFNTFVFFAGVPIAIGLALGLALVLNQRFLGNSIFRSSIFLPYVTMMVAVAVMWAYIFDTERGVLNYLLLNLGLIQEPISWLTSTFWSRVSIIIVYVWKSVGFYLIIILAGLQDIPEQLYEVARLDGAGLYQRYRYVTLPLLLPYLGICALIGIINSFQLFALIMELTGRGPGDSTEILVTYLYTQAFTYGDMGYGAALSVVLFVIMMAIVGIGRLVQRRVQP